jgi:hypothetical protein
MISRLTLLLEIMIRLMKFSKLMFRRQSPTTMVYLLMGFVSKGITVRDLIKP